MPRVLQFVLFISVAILILTGIHWFLWARLVRDSAMPLPWGRLARWLIVGLALSIPLAMVLGRTLPFNVSRLLVIVPYVWMGTMFLLFALLFAVDLVRFCAWLIEKVGGHGPLIDDPARRLFVRRLIAGAVAGLALGATGVGVIAALGPLAVRRITVPLRRLPRVLDGFRIVQLTDLHVGLTLGRDWIDRVVDETLAAKPDLVAITGDLVDGTPDRLRDEVAPLARLRAPHGVFFVTGNHEYYSGVTAWLPELERLGVRVLRNERVSIGEGEAAFDLAGIDDHNADGMVPGHRPDLAKALRGRDPRRELVLLAHQPRAIAEAAANGVGLVLSGHTHGGQIFPFDKLVRLQQPYVSGLHDHGGTWIYVSDGTGFWGPPVRVGTRSEITIVELRASARESG